MVTSYLTQISLKNDSSQGRCLLCRHNPKLGTLKDYLDNLEEVNHGRYLLDLLKSFDSLGKENVILPMC